MVGRIANKSDKSAGGLLIRPINRGRIGNPSYEFGPLSCD